MEHDVKKSIWAKVRETAGKVPFVPDAVALYFCATDPRTPLHAKLTAFSALSYFILPADAIPDFILLGGYADDAGAIAVALRALAPFVTDEHRARAAGWLAGKPYTPAGA